MLPTPTLHLYINKGLFATYFNLVYFVQLSRKNYKANQKLKTQFEETHEATEPDMARVLELPDREFKATAINMLRALLDEVDSMQENMTNANRGIEIPEKNKNEILKIRKHYNKNKEFL